MPQTLQRDEVHAAVDREWRGGFNVSRSEIVRRFSGRGVSRASLFNWVNARIVVLRVDDVTRAGGGRNRDAFDESPVCPSTSPAFLDCHTGLELRLAGLSQRPAYRTGCTRSPALASVGQPGPELCCQSSPRPWLARRHDRSRLPRGLTIFWSMQSGASRRLGIIESTWPRAGKTAGSVVRPRKSRSCA